MTYRTMFETVIVNADNLAQFPGYRPGDFVQVRHEATEVDLRLFTQLADILGMPFPDA